MEKAVVCLVSSREQAVTIVSQLQAAGIANEEISAIFPHHEDGHEFAREHHIDIPDAAIPGGVAGAAAGATIGGTIGLLAGVGALAIPGIGPLVAVGPLAALLSGAVTGATLGTVAGGLITMGISETHAKHLENKLKDGQIILSVHTDSPDMLEIASDVFKRAGATDLESASPTS